VVSKPDFFQKLKENFTSLHERLSFGQESMSFLSYIMLLYVTLRLSLTGNSLPSEVPLLEEPIVAHLAWKVSLCLYKGNRFFPISVYYSINSSSRLLPVFTSLPGFIAGLDLSYPFKFSKLWLVLSF
jgi:hypothetical protein